MFFGGTTFLYVKNTGKSIEILAYVATQANDYLTQSKYITARLVEQKNGSF